MNPPQGANSPTITPRTDAFYETRMMSPPANWGKRDADALTDFARQLETEHAQLVARVASLEGALRDYYMVTIKVIQANNSENLDDINNAAEQLRGAAEEARALLSPVPQEGQKK